ncbi:YbaN family protein [Peredibacter sp. HCB2-198]|uniref:YbaN family protein n=1 Tax=Peredibacter sp. HCB2-198 TaxID=3383025 RepID=UPI0038B53017
MKPIWFVCAWIAFAIGIVGAFLPVLPTTPFLILAAFLFSKSSPRFHAWLLNLPLAGDGIRDWQHNRVIRTKAKVLCSVMIFLSLVVILTNGNIHMAVKIIVPIILVSVWAFVVTRKSE